MLRAWMCLVAIWDCVNEYSWMNEWVNQSYGTNETSGFHLAYARDAEKCICLFQYRKIAAAARSPRQFEHQIIYYSGSIVDLIFVSKTVSCYELEQWTVNNEYTTNRHSWCLFDVCEYEQWNITAINAILIHMCALPLSDEMQNSFYQLQTAHQMNLLKKLLWSWTAAQKLMFNKHRKNIYAIKLKIKFFFVIMSNAVGHYFVCVCV